MNIGLIGLKYSYPQIARGIEGNSFSHEFFPVELPNRGDDLKKDSFENQLATSFLKALRALVDRKKEGGGFDFVLILKGFKATEESKTLLSSIDLPIGIWAYDSFSRCPEQFDHYEQAHWVFVQDGKDIDRFPKRTTFLPLGFDPHTFFPNKSKKAFDVLMIGNFFSNHYSTRRRVIRKLNNLASQGVRIGIVGFSGSRLGMLMFKVLFFRLKFFGRVGLERINQLLNQTSIAVNYHQDDGEMPVNPFFFSIPATQTLMISDKRPYLHRFLEPGVEYLESEEADLEKAIVKLLREPKNQEKIAFAGYQASVKKHTYTERVKIVAEILTSGRV